tara:strand:- start:2289 stop:2513 length:225 start_codon:yes stop_codon:yes gene_type:complete
MISKIGVGVGSGMRMTIGVGVGVGVGVGMGVGIGSGVGTIGLPEETTPDVAPAQELMKRKTEHSRQLKTNRINR